MAKTLDELLTDLEEDIRRLKIEFDIYFNGGTKRPPLDSKHRVEAMLKRLGDDRTMRFGTRFRYNQIVARYTAFRELWRRNVQAIEEGRDARSQHAALVAGGAVKSAETEWDRFQHQDEFELNMDLDKAFDSIFDDEPQRFRPTTVRFSDPAYEEHNVRRLYDTVIEAKRQCGEPTDNTPYDRFREMVAYNTNKLKAQRNCSEVNFTVDIEDGKVKFKAG